MAVPARASVLIPFVRKKQAAEASSSTPQRRRKLRRGIDLDSSSTREYVAGCRGTNETPGLTPCPA